jgi:hypothetical protein
MKRDGRSGGQRSRHLFTVLGRYAWRWHFSKWRGCRLVAVTRDYSGGGVVGTLLHSVGDARMKRDEQLAADGVYTPPQAVLGAWAKNCPVLGAYMTDRRWEDGTERLTAWLTWKVEADTWVAELNDPNYGRQLRCEELKPEMLLPALESQLMLAAPPWRYPEWLKRYLPKQSGKGVDRKKGKR